MKERVTEALLPGCGNDLGSSVNGFSCTATQ